MPAVQDRLVYEVPVADIRPSPRNPRRAFDGIDELADSIQAHGLLQPIVVRPVAGGYEVVAGHRRLAAVQRLGWSKVPAVVRDEDQDEAYILTLVENLQREDLSPKEEAAALEVLVRERGWSTRQVGEAIKRSHIYVSRRLRVFEDSVLSPLVLKEGLAVSTAEELLREQDADSRARLAAQASQARWTPADARRAVREAKWNDSFQQAPAPRLASRIRALANELSSVDPTGLPPTARHDLRKLLEVVQALHATMDTVHDDPRRRSTTHA